MLSPITLVVHDDSPGYIIRDTYKSPPSTSYWNAQTLERAPSPTGNTQFELSIDRIHNTSDSQPVLAVFRNGRWGVLNMREGRLELHLRNDTRVSDALRRGDTYNNRVMRAYPILLPFLPIPPNSQKAKALDLPPLRSFLDDLTDRPLVSTLKEALDSLAPLDLPAVEVGTQNTFETLLRSLYGLPIEIPTVLISEYGRARVIPFSEASDLIANGRVAHYTIEPRLQPWAGNPDSMNRMITLNVGDGVVVVKAKYNKEAGVIEPPTEMA